MGMGGSGSGVCIFQPLLPLLPLLPRQLNAYPCHDAMMGEGKMDYTLGQGICISFLTRQYLAISAGVLSHTYR